MKPDFSMGIAGGKSSSFERKNIINFLSQKNKLQKSAIELENPLAQMEILSRINRPYYFHSGFFFQH